LMKSHLSILVLFSWATGAWSEKKIICAYIFKSFSTVISRFLWITLKCFIPFQLIFIQGLISVFYMWISVFPSPFVEKPVFFSNVCFSFLCQKWECCSCVSLFLHILFFSIGHVFLLCQYHDFCFTMV
jgi:hypothetical protein